MISNTHLSELQAGIRHHWPETHIIYSKGLIKGSGTFNTFCVALILQVSRNTAASPGRRCYLCAHSLNSSKGNISKSLLYFWISITMADRWLLARLFTYKLQQSFFYCCHDLVGKHFIITQLSLPLVKFHCWKVTFVIIWERWLGKRSDWRTCLSWTLSSIQHLKITKHRQSKTNQKHPHITWQWIIIIYVSRS